MLLIVAWLVFISKVKAEEGNYLRIQNEMMQSTPALAYYTGTQTCNGNICGCDWTTNAGACSNNDGSICWACCCLGPNAGFPTVAPTNFAGTRTCNGNICGCSWTANNGACSNNDGSVCWACCCQNQSGNSPSSGPTVQPTTAPSLQPSVGPSSVKPSLSPTFGPTPSPSFGPSRVPTFIPSNGPTSVKPSVGPTPYPTNGPTPNPTVGPTPYPAFGPSIAPTSNPPSPVPTSNKPAGPTFSPTNTPYPTSGPSIAPTFCPSATPSLLPTSVKPSSGPTPSPTNTQLPTFGPSIAPTNPSQKPSTSPTNSPSTSPLNPSYGPSIVPTTLNPSVSPSLVPTPYKPTTGPSFIPTNNINPTVGPSITPSLNPSFKPTTLPTSNKPSAQPTPSPSSGPSISPTTVPSSQKPTVGPTMVPNAIAPTPVPSYFTGTRTCNGNTCGCSWANAQSCTNNDGSVCWSCCCLNQAAGTPTIAPTTNAVPTTLPPSTPTAPTAGFTYYCPAANDLTVAYGSATIVNQGWTISNGGGVATKSTYNLIGGSVDFDVDFSSALLGVNANIYTVSPAISSTGYTSNSYCDGSRTDSSWCLEVDWIESNGNCGGQTTLHTVEGSGNGCNAGGCTNAYSYNSQPTFHMTIKYAADGTWTTIHNGQVISPNNLSPVPGTTDWSIVVANYQSKGALIYSSQWVGWVPTAQGCNGAGGNLAGSKFTISNLKIYGAVVQGPTPTLC